MATVKQIIEKKTFIPEKNYFKCDDVRVSREETDKEIELLSNKLKEAGYKVSGLENTSSILFEKTYNGETYFVLLVKEIDKGYLRVFNDIGGLDFHR